MVVDGFSYFHMASDGFLTATTRSHTVDHMSSTQAPTPFVQPIELAKRWGINHKTVLTAVHDGKIPATRVGRRLLIPRAWVEAQEQPETQPAAS